jgi:hypothetical protein
MSLLFLEVDRGVLLSNLCTTFVGRLIHVREIDILPNHRCCIHQLLKLPTIAELPIQAQLTSALFPYRQTPAQFPPRTNLLFLVHELQQKRCCQVEQSFDYVLE